MDGYKTSALDTNTAGYMADNQESQDMSGINAHANMLGGGLGGWGGYGGCGLGGVGLVGLLGLTDGFGRRHDDCGEGRCAEKLISMYADSTNEKFSLLNANINKGQAEDTIRDVRQTLHEDAMHARTALDVFAVGTARDFGDVKTGLRDLAYQNTLGVERIISSQKDCCCETKQAIHAEGEATRALINQKAYEKLLTQNAELKSELSNSRQTDYLKDFMRAVLAGAPAAAATATAPAA